MTRRPAFCGVNDASSQPAERLAPSTRDEESLAPKITQAHFSLDLCSAKSHLHTPPQSAGPDPFIRTGALTDEPIKAVVSRARPYTTGCEQNGSGYSPACATRDANKSFYSGHASSAFTAAGLLCRNHLSLNTARSQLQNVLICTSSLTIAAATAVLRISADRHYFSDVLTGATIGFAVGYFLPRLLYSFEEGEEPTKEKTSAVLLHPVSGGGLGVQLQYRL